MGRSHKKRPANARGTHKPAPIAATTPAPKPSPPNPAQAPAPAPTNPAPAPLREGVSVPRSTTDEPWRNLHPARVWPD